MTEQLRLLRLSRWFATIRLLAVPFAASEVLTSDMPAGYDTWAWVVVGVLAAGGAVSLAATTLPLDVRTLRWIAGSALTFDTLIATSFVFLFSFENGQPVWTIYYLPILEGALRFGIAGGLLTSIGVAPLLAAAELFRSRRFEPEVYRLDVVAIRVGLGVIIGAVVGRLVASLVEQGSLAEARAGESERLRDQLARRVDVLEAANRCARALGSSLDQETAFRAFIRELRGLVRFDRVAVVLAEEEVARVIAVAGATAETLYPAGTELPLAVLDVMGGRTVYRPDMAADGRADESDLVAAGLRSRLSAPLLLGARPIGSLSLTRAEPDAFGAEEIELVTLLGRLVATAVQNIRAYDAERQNVQELRRLSALRADFVSLVSHELRSPMAAVIGAARTLQERWRQLTPEQRQSFLALIADETTRLAALIGDVLDTSRIEAGTFNYSFGEIDLADLVHDTAAAASVGQDEVRVRAAVRGPLPRVRGDRERLRQVLVNLIENAVKYSAAGDEVEVAATASNGHVLVSVRDRGPGIPKEHQRLIFEKFARAKVGGSGKPGTGLGLFIARSIAEAHGGSIEVRSVPGQGATFTLALPVEREG